MSNQLEISFSVLTPQNNRESEEILLMCAKRLSKNCQTILEALKRGERLTGNIIVEKYKIMEYRRRFKDLKDAGYKIDYEIGSNGCKTWYLAG